MENVIYPQKFKNKLRSLVGMKPVLTEPEIVLDQQMLLSLFKRSSLMQGLKELRVDTDYVECEFSYDAKGHFKSVTFRTFNKKERESYK